MHTTLLDAGAVYAASNFPVMIERDLPLLDMVINKHKHFNVSERYGTQVRHPIGTSRSGTVGTQTTYGNPFAFKQSGIVNQLDTTGRRAYTGDPKYVHFDIAQMDGPFVVSLEQEKLYEKAPVTGRASLIEAVGNDMLEFARQFISVNLLGVDTNAARNQFLSLPYLCKGNTIGNINPATETLYQARYTAGSRTLTKNVIDSELQLMKDRKAKTDLMLLSGSGTDIYGTMMQYVDQQVIIQKASSEGGTGNYGFDNYLYRGIMVARDVDLAANQFFMLDTSELYWDGEETPESTEAYVFPFTSVKGKTLTLFAQLSVRNVRKQNLFIATA